MTKGRIPCGRVFLTDQNVQTIESVSVPKIITKFGYNKTTVLPIRVGPKELGGAGFYAFLNTIKASRVHHFLVTWKISWEGIGKVLRIAMVWIQYIERVSYPIL